MNGFLGGSICQLAISLQAWATDVFLDGSICQSETSLQAWTMNVFLDGSICHLAISLQAWVMKVFLSGPLCHLARSLQASTVVFSSTNSFETLVIQIWEIMLTQWRNNASGRFNQVGQVIGWGVKQNLTPRSSGPRGWGWQPHNGIHLKILKWGKHFCYRS